MALAGKSFYLAGSAGTGKSVTLEEIVTRLREKEGRVVVVTSSTGLSAENVGGITLHSFSGIGYGMGLAAEELAERIKVKDSAVGWRICNVLIIDEISMISADFFSKLDFIARAVRENPDEFFGGIQVIAVGDFFQLPPIGGDFAFRSKVWRKHMRKSVLLKTIYRQKNEQLALWMNMIRRGKLPVMFQEMVNQSKGMDPLTMVTPTRLFCRNVDVDKANLEELAKLPHPSVVFKAITVGEASPEDRASKKKDADPLVVPKKEPNPYRIPEELTLKLKAQVIFLRNTDSYRNGTRGVVVGFFHSDDERCEGDGDDPPRKRARMAETPPDGVRVMKVDGTVIDVLPVPFEISRNGKVVGTRTGLPLKLAWSLTIHKAQGMSIDALEIDFRGVQGPAIVYVALSRATSLAGLRVFGLCADIVFAHPQVEDYYSDLEDRLLGGAEGDEEEHRDSDEEVFEEETMMYHGGAQEEQSHSWE